MSTPIYGRVDLKAQAKLLREFQTDLSHSAALETVSRWHGFKDWNTASATLPEEVPVTYPVGRALLDDLKSTLERCNFRDWSAPIQADFYPWYVKVNAFLNRMNETDFKVASVLIRFAVGPEYRLPFHMKKMPGFDRYVERMHEELPNLNAMIQIDEWIEEFDPGYRLARLAKDPWKTAELNGAVQRLARENPIWNADEAVEYFTASHRPFNENTVRGLWKRFRGEPAKLISTTRA